MVTKMAFVVRTIKRHHFFLVLAALAGPLPTTDADLLVLLGVLGDVVETFSLTASDTVCFFCLLRLVSQSVDGLLGEDTTGLCSGDRPSTTRLGRLAVGDLSRVTSSSFSLFAARADSGIFFVGEELNESFFGEAFFLSSVTFILWGVQGRSLSTFLISSGDSSLGFLPAADDDDCSSFAETGCLGRFFKKLLMSGVETSFDDVGLVSLVSFLFPRLKYDSPNF
jgi:hypothetical protein